MHTEAVLVACSASSFYHAVKTRTRHCCGIIHSPSKAFLFTLIFTDFSWKQVLHNHLAFSPKLFNWSRKISAVQLQAFKICLHSKHRNTSGFKSEVWGVICFKYKILSLALLKVPLSVLQKLLSHSVHPAVLETPCTLAQRVTTPCGSFI